MFYYEVLIADSKFHGQTAITYSSTAELDYGQVVNVPLRDRLALAIIGKRVAKPSFKTKEIAEVLSLPSLPIESLRLLEWMRQYYPSPIGPLTQLFVPNHLTNKLIPNEEKNYYPETPALMPPLTQEQRVTLSKLKKRGTYLLHGETGSGKTRIYQELAIRELADGKSAIILTPEISLTSQLAKNFVSIFGKQVIIIHSKLTSKERRDLWLELLRSPTPHVVIGPRSALFSPLQKIGLVVVDEEQETAYKQDQTPRYDGLRVASQLSKLHGSILLFGSATPSVVDYYIAESTSVPILRMIKPAKKNSSFSMKIELIDLKDVSLFSRSRQISDTLLQAIAKALENREQVLLFINRRGTARLVLCSVCGWQALCPNCDVPLTYHGDDHRLHCHICGHAQNAPINCPACQNADITYRGTGTKTIVQEVQRLFTGAHVRRFDTDNLKTERFEQQYDSILGGNVDILVGTQTLAKGLDLPALSVVGVINADTGLYSPDFNAGEKTYQLISQVVGRVGRGHRNGHAIIQTYQPENPIIRAALEKDWSNFYKNELAERRKYRFPPFCHLLKLNVRRSTTASAEQSAKKLADMLIRQNLRIEIVGPSPAFHEKTLGKYEWQLVIKAGSRSELLKAVEMIPSGWTYDIDPASLL